MVFTNKYTRYLIEKFEGFSKSDSLAEAIEPYKDGESINIYAVFTGLADYVIKELANKSINITDEEISIYLFLEEIRCRYAKSRPGTDEFDLDNAVCTCFLENLLNKGSWGDICYSRFVPYLGEKSREYCRAWDHFTGVKTPGLWDEEV